jgi:ketosteroid isomerase-like protein
MKRVVVVALLLAGLSSTVRAQEADVRQLMTAFITALQNLDWPAFRECWAEKPVMYGPESSTRNEGPTFESTWKEQFQRMREAAAARGNTVAPYTKIDPQGMRIDFPTPTVDVVTFHLANSSRTSPRGGVTGRRMFVVAKTAMGWKITHMNNSDLAPRQ